MDFLLLHSLYKHTHHSPKDIYTDHNLLGFSKKQLTEMQPQRIIQIRNKQFPDVKLLSEEEPANIKFPFK
jgi:hypothetical protein